MKRRKYMRLVNIMLILTLSVIFLFELQSASAVWVDIPDKVVTLAYDHSSSGTAYYRGDLNIPRSHYKGSVSVTIDTLLTKNGWCYKGTSRATDSKEFEIYPPSNDIGHTLHLNSQWSYPATTGTTSLSGSIGWLTNGYYRINANVWTPCDIKAFTYTVRLTHEFQCACTGTSCHSPNNGRKCNGCDYVDVSTTAEVCNRIDDNCDGRIDDIDKDRDGYSPCVDSWNSNYDCNDLIPSIYYSAQEVLDGSDNNCNNQIDEYLIPDGSQCLSDYQCSVSGSRCNLGLGNRNNLGKCSQRLGDGQPCTRHFDCTANYCKSSGTCGKVQDSSTCSSDGDCVSGLCSGYGFSGVCGKLVNGNSCDRDIECESYNCQGIVCSPKRQNGVSCQSHSQCQSGYCDSSRKCGNKKGDGDTCINNDACSSNICHNSKCVPSDCNSMLQSMNQNCCIRSGFVWSGSNCCGDTITQQMFDNIWYDSAQPEICPSATLVIPDYDDDCDGLSDAEDPDCCNLNTNVYINSKAYAGGVVACIPRSDPKSGCTPQ